MKKLFILMGVMSLSLTFTGCGSDEPAEPVGKNLVDPAYKSLSATYFDISKSNPANEEALGDVADELIFKFGEDGKAWVFSLNKKVVKEAEPCSNPKRHRALLQQENESWYVYATEYQEKAGSYDVKNVGKFSISADNNVTLQIGNQPAKNLVAEKVESPIQDNSTVNQMCRSWKVAQTRIEVSEGDLNNAYGKVFKGNYAVDLAYIAADIDNPDNGIKTNMTKYLRDNNRLTSIKEIVLSRTGVLTIFYKNGKQDVASIGNIANNSNISLNWLGSNLSNDYLSGEMGVYGKIKNNYFVLTFNSPITANNVAKPYKVKVEFTLEWAGR